METRDQILAELREKQQWLANSYSNWCKRTDNSDEESETIVSMLDLLIKLEERR